MYLFLQLQTAYNVRVRNSGELLISNVQNTDAGAYKCVATNDAGSDSATVNLEVGCKFSSDRLLLRLTWRLDVSSPLTSYCYS